MNAPAPDPNPTRDAELRSVLLDTMRAMGTAGLNVGTAGNASVRLKTAQTRSADESVADGVTDFDPSPTHLRPAVHMLITPSGLAAEHCGVLDLAHVDSDGHAHGPFAPSSEWQLHRDIYAAFPAAGAVLHAHSPFATALACQRIDIPPFHYMIARFGGSSIRCARYATFGTQALSDATVAALHERNACLLANHGMVVFGRDLSQALALAIEFETLCAQYWRSLQIGAPVLLSEAEMAEVIERFRWYGKPRA